MARQLHWLASLLALCLIGAGAARAQELAPQPGLEATEPERRLPEVLARAASDRLELRRIDGRSERTEAVEQLLLALPEKERELEEKVREAQAEIGAATRMRALEEIEKVWRIERTDLETWSQTLTDRALALQSDMERLEELAEPWHWARQEARRLGAPASVLGNIRAALTAIDDTRERVAARWSEKLGLEGRLGDSLATVAAVLDRSASQRLALQEALLGRGRQPLWQALDWPAAEQGRLAMIGENLTRMWRNLAEFAQARRSALLLHGLLILALVAAGLGLRPSAARWAAQDASLQPTAELLTRPYSAALVVGLTLTPVLHPDAPRALSYFGSLIVMISLLRLVALLLRGSVRAGFYGLAVLYLAERLREVLTGLELADRLLFTVELFALVAGLAWLLLGDRRADLPGSERARRTLSLAIAIALGLAGIALGSTLVGYPGLAELLGEGVMRSGLVGTLIYAGYRVLAGLTAIALRARLAQRSNLVRTQRAQITRRLQQLLGLASGAYWLYFTLVGFGLAGSLATGAAEWLASEIQLGELTVSLSDALWLAGSIVAALYLARIVRAVLEDDVFARLDMPRGVGRAIAVSASYVVLLVGFMLAFATAGIDIARFAILAGALGVGIGFGLQNVVNNFVSGLILIFQRPVQPGDTIELDQLLGEVRRIGIYSTTVRTFQGAEVIVPNADLISNRVTNWTLSDRRRRLDLEIRVAYGTDLAQVLGLLIRVARSEERILDDPEPTALFRGFGDSSLDFELRAWTGDSAYWVQVASDLLVAVNDALGRAGIEIPFPQHDIHLRSVDPGARG